jgi:hypothetical protein
MICRKIFRVNQTNIKLKQNKNKFNFLEIFRIRPLNTYTEKIIKLKIILIKINTFKILASKDRTQKSLSKYNK